MTPIWRAKFWLGTLLTTIFVILSQEIEILAAPRWLLAIIAFVISTYASTFSIDWALKREWGRMLIMGKNWIEGHWYLRTADVGGHPHPITNDGITHISHDGYEFALKVNTYRTKPKADVDEFTSVSEITTITEYDTHFTNYFNLHAGGLNPTHGISVGTFFRAHDPKYPDQYEGGVVLFSDGVYRRQLAYKIPEEIVKSLRQSDGDRWKDALLSRGYEHLLEGNGLLDKPQFEQKESRKQQVAANSKRIYLAALLFVSIFIASTTILLGTVSGAFRPASDTPTWVAVFTAIVSAIGTISTTLLAWKSDRRAARGNDLIIAQLKQKLHETKQEPDPPDDTGQEPDPPDSENRK